MATSVAAIACRPPFTAAQWAELEHQALIFKYMMAGMPIPPELILPIHRSFEAMAARLYHHPTMGYCSYYGKKLDPEPGRCRRTDGKKWRCAKDAYQDSKYCERHMHRGRNRSRKPVEAQTLSHSSSSTVASLAPAGGSSSGSLQGITLAPLAGGGEAGLPSLLLESGSYGMDNKDFRYLQGVKTEADEQSFFTETTGSAKSLVTNSSLDSRWRVVPSSMPRNGSVAQTTYPQRQSLQDFGHGTVNLMPKQQQQQQQQHQSFFRNEFASSVAAKHETQSLRPFFDEWPQTRDPWSDLEEDKANHTSFSTTQLSISIPMTSSDFSTTSSRSPNDVDD